MDSKSHPIEILVLNKLCGAGEIVLAGHLTQPSDLSCVTGRAEA